MRPHYTEGQIQTMTQKLKTKEGLLWIDDKLVNLPMADWVARAFGYNYVEELVRALEENPNVLRESTE